MVAEAALSEGFPSVGSVAYLQQVLGGVAAPFLPTVAAGGNFLGLGVVVLEDLEVLGVLEKCGIAEAAEMGQS